MDILKSWWMLSWRGAAALLFGLLALISPEITLIVLVALFAAFALIGGAASIIVAIRHQGNDRGWWLMLLLLGRPIPTSHKFPHGPVNELRVKKLPRRKSASSVVYVVSDDREFPLSGQGHITRCNGLAKIFVAFTEFCAISSSEQ